MKQLFLGIIAMLMTTLALADGPVGYPGSTWGQFVTPSSVVKGTPEDGNWLYQGKVTQGVDWVKFGPSNSWVFDTYLSVGFSMDKNRLSYNNKLVPAVGAKIVRTFSKGVIDVGAEVVHEEHFGDVYDGATPVGQRLSQNGTGVQAYVSYWFGWNLGK